ncbi:hypothetical protein HIM_00691 [Hirsutella minnesotensis 3608]|nr:hypothetical protein HIM_00691 [Hirsutella minnesotensis 3608]
MSRPWLDQPVMLHSSRDAGHCMMTPEQCAYKSRYWVFWYEADHRYGLPTTAFFLATILFFAMFNSLSLLAPRGWRQSGGWLRLVGVSRLFTYKSWRIGRWSSQSMGVYLLGAVGVLFFAAMTLGPRPYYWPNTKELSFGGSPPIATRAGYMALACLPFLLILGAKANPITALTGVPHERLNVYHGWVAWAMFVLALVHTFPFIIFHIWKGDIVKQWNTGGIWITGVIALLAQAWLTIMSIRWIRNRFYEFFKATHYFFAAVFVVFFFIHCDFRLTSWDYFIAAGVLYFSSWFYSQSKTYLEHGFRHKAHLTLVTDQTLKIVVPTSAKWRPGQHVYLRFLTGDLHLLTTHPFTICSTPKASGASEMVFYVERRGGITGRLCSRAEKQPGAVIPVLLDGPYSGIPARWFDGFDQYLLVGGGAGAGFTLSLVDHFLLSQANNQGNQKLTVVISTRDPDLRHWYLDALHQMTSLLETEKALVDVCIYETSNVELRKTRKDEESGVGQKSEKPSADDKASSVGDSAVFNIRFLSGRPDIKTICRGFTRQDGVTVGLIACGPSSMVHDVSQSAAEAQQDILRGRKGAREVWFHKESFS